MKKTKLLVVVLVVAIMLMGAGYAYWNETLTIESTVDTGTLNVQFAPCGYAVGDFDRKADIPNDIWNLLQNPQDFDGADYIDVTANGSDNNHKLTFTIQDIYPGSGGYLSFLIVNTGTTPAKLLNISDTVKKETEAGLRDELDYTIQSLVLVKKNSIWGFPLPPKFDIVNSPIKCDTYAQFVTKLSDLMDGYTLEPGDYFELNKGDIFTEAAGYNIEMSKNTSDNKFEGKEFKFDLVLNFQQTE